MIEIKTEPSPTELRVFAVLWLVFFVAFGLIGRHGGDGLLTAAVVIGACFLASMVFNREYPRRSQLLGLSMPLGLTVVWAIGSGRAVDAASTDPIGWGVFGVLSAIGLLGCVVCLASAQSAKRLYRGWMLAAMPIGWTISHVILALVLFGLMTPIGLVMKLIGRDPMQRSFDREATSYWAGHEQVKDSKRYFRQF